MVSPIASVPTRGTCIEEERAFSLDQERIELQETPVPSKRAARGMITGVLLGAGLWGAILVLVGVIKL
jgi:hypothetical protein